ncbi:MAG: tetratricopeptide repeat protein, partial [Bacteroidia bacterium]|nr:tetratricopeptide repeat protein [Bacteroidia bacterium]
MKLHYRFILVVLVCSLASNSYSQRNYKYHTSSKKAIKLFELGTDQYDLRKAGLAAKYIEEAVTVDSNFIEAHTLLGDVYYDLKVYDKSAKAYLHAIRIDPNFFSKTYKNLARAEIKRMRYDNAIEALKKYLDTPN